ncbi:response regulator [soil metagenome]
MTSIDPEGPAAASPADLPTDVLVVEDDPLIALDASETIRAFGVASVRTAGSVAGASRLIAERAPDFVLLDVGLIREKSFAVAEQLETLKIPFVFVTGYSGDGRIPARFAHIAVLAKPYLRDALLDALRGWRTQR